MHEMFVRLNRRRTSLRLILYVLASSLFLWSQIPEPVPDDPTVTEPHHSRLLALGRLTRKTIRQCPQGFVFMENIDTFSNPGVVENGIPRIVHQTSKSRCVTRVISNGCASWRLGSGWAYYFHDDEAVMRLFSNSRHDFPLLETVVSKCLVHGTLKADLWRYLVLYKYGGIYADLDTKPNKLHPDMLVGNDALFVVEQYHLLSQYFMAVSPRHPLMWYAVQHALINLIQVSDTGSAPASLVTGPHALHAAYIDFRKDAGVSVQPALPGFKPVWAGTFVGTGNRTVKVIGIGENQNEFVERDFIRSRKRDEYARMDMRHFQDDKKYPTGRSCLSAIYEICM